MIEDQAERKVAMDEFEFEELPLEDARESARRGKKELDRRAANKAVDTKGPEERSRESYMAWWTIKNGKNDAENPYSKENYYRDRPD